jgi:ring-1,2-phenylacetyl-CoA epoxidase subunit PaaE
MARHAVFHSLRVAEIEKLTEDAVAIGFDVPDDLVEDYRFTPGQHVTVRTPKAGDDIRRNYSICATPAQGRLRIGVKRISGGGFSTYAMERMRVGDEIDVMTPTGRFCTTPDPARSRHLACVAAGSGITPILSILGSVLETEPASSATLLYGNRGVSSVMFLDELTDLKDRFTDRFQLIHVLSREQPDVELFAGRIDRPKFTRLLGSLLPPDTVDEWYLCGPHDMVDQIRRVLSEAGVPREHVHTELFHAGPTPAPQRLPTGAEPGGECEVTAILDGRRSTFRLASDGPPVLEAVLGVRGDAPFACRGGVCGTCRARVVEGAVRMDQCYALEPEEVENGYALTCQSHPTTERLIVDYDG